MTLYIKIGAALALILFLFFGGYYCGGLSGKAKLAAVQQSQAQLVAKTLLAQKANTDQEMTRLNKVIATYENTPIDPVAVTVGSRVYKYAAAHCGAVPQAPAPTSGTVPAASVPSSPGPIERATNDAFAACSHDANLVIALQAAWTR